MTTLPAVIPTDVAINYVVTSPVVVPVNKAAEKLAFTAACQEVRRAVNAWLYTKGV